MGLFGGGSKTSTSKISRPSYLNALISDVSKQAKSTDVGEYVNQTYAGLNKEQTEALNRMLSGDELNGYANQLINSGAEGLGQLDSYYNQIADLYGKDSITAEDINNLAGQLYNPENVQEAIDSNNANSLRQFGRETNPALAQQYNQQGFGSGARVARDMAASNLAQQQQEAASALSNNAYNNAMQQAQGILTGNLSNRRSALGALGTNALNQSNYLNQGAQLSQDQLNQSLSAAQQQYQNEQNRLNMDYQNKINAQNWGNLQTQYQLGLAGALNSAQGQTTKTTVSGGGSGMLGGAMSGAAAGSAFGPWGALAGAAIGAAASA